MTSPNWVASVEAAFADDRELCHRIFTAVATDSVPLPQVFEEISRYVLALKNERSQDIQPNGKKRKLEDGVAVSASSSQPPAILFECREVSFTAPARKKLKLEFVADAVNQQKRAIRLIHPTTGELEYSLAADEIDHVFCLPMPEKQARQQNFVIVPKSEVQEQIVFTLNETAPAGLSIANGTIGDEDTYVSVTHTALQDLLRPFGKEVVLPSIEEFASSIPQSHRKGEKAFHVKAHRGSKEGYLFFLSTGILFGFKKPITFFPFSAVESISYTSVLQRTFNLVIAAMEGEASQTKEVEFSMIDQEDFAGIDDYVKRHGLNDASMAAQRRAKVHNVNKEKKVEGAEANGEVGVGGVEDWATELQKAEQLLQDEEDEEEEDYEASGGESDGEGEESDEDGEEDAEGEYDEEVEGDEDGMVYDDEEEHEE